ncbi:methyltransferase domain-containing protein [Epibacterium ulvae]|uniref:class I SAM-dependent methyltransferase n=1 Tax=Epibacterium ulvae TaxID=1156985 RepID=UPI001BFCA937|nr:methyltransferase domain-containing protein [Epibacterium ulvae]MBT8153433.1 methyltransferase domain-containing protein [Epibacterium ulvae]
MSDTTEHSALMDQTYRYQRLIYDVTRKYYLLGRDHLIEGMNVQPGERVLEVACGTGRNLSLIRNRYPEAQLFGLDISDQMLTTARAKLGADVSLAQGDACQFEPKALFDVEGFDHVILSYSLSMIPDWQGALTEAKRHLAPGGRLHVVDFGDSAGLPGWFQRLLLAWLARFHVSPRDTLEAAMRDCRADTDRLVVQGLYRNYAFYGQLTKDDAA